MGRMFRIKTVGNGQYLAGVYPEHPVHPVITAVKNPEERS
jgi:hypothetical protein